jgi:hypothetical protein
MNKVFAVLWAVTLVVVVVVAIGIADMYRVEYIVTEGDAYKHNRSTHQFYYLDTDKEPSEWTKIEEEDYTTALKAI